LLRECVNVCPKPGKIIASSFAISDVARNVGAD
jgi:hypothetical protein